MALKTFNVDEKVYEEFSKHCKKNGISMSRRIENFIRSEIENIRQNISEEPKIKEITKPSEIEKTELHHHPLSKYC